jgi:hypothetical protein
MLDALGDSHNTSREDGLPHFTHSLPETGDDNDNELMNDDGCTRVFTGFLPPVPGWSSRMPAQDVLVECLKWRHCR